MAEEELQALYDNLRQIRLVNCVAISCAAFVAYDILTNLDKEIPLIWRYYHNTNNDEHTSWRRRALRILVQTLFVFGRYYALLYLVVFFAVNNSQGLSVSLCVLVWTCFAYADHFAPKAARLTSTISFLEGNYHTRRSSTLFWWSVLMPCTKSSTVRRDYESTKSFLCLWPSLNLWFVILQQAEFVVGAVMAIWMVRRAIGPPAGVPWPGCRLSENVNNALTLPAWVTAILVATIFLGLTLRLLYSSMKLRFRRFGDFTISNIKEEIRNIQPITLTLVRDSVLIYFPMFGILVASVPIMVVYNTAVASVTVPIISALYSFCASRLIIHTREGLSRLSHDVQSREIGSIIYASQSLKASHAWMPT